MVQLTRVRRLIAENMTRSKTTIPHAWQTQEADMSGVVANRAANKAAFQKQEGFSLTYLPYVMAATVSALREHPEVNSTFNETELIVHRDINLGVSVGLEDTLVVPVVRRADGLSIAGLARAVNDIATRARNKQLKADDLAGATFTVNNSGTFGTLFSYSVINPGQAGILTMEAIVDRPVADRGDDRDQADDVPLLLIRPPRARRPAGGAIPGVVQEVARSGYRGVADLLADVPSTSIDRMLMKKLANTV